MDLLFRKSIFVYRQSEAGNEKYGYELHARSGLRILSPTHKRTEGCAPVWGSEFTSKRRRTPGEIQKKPL